MTKKTGKKRRRPQLAGFADRLREYISEAGGASYVSTQMGIGFTTMCKWQSGENEPSLHHIRDMALYFDVSTDDLLGVQTTRGGEARALGRTRDLSMWKRRERARRATLHVGAKT